MPSSREPDNAIEIFPLPEDIVVERDVGVVMQAGTRLNGDLGLPRDHRVGGHAALE
jgi:hypothetical protein